MAILITGAKGFVGRNLVEFFKEKKYSVLFPTQKELDLRNSDDVARYFQNNLIECIVHCATTLREGTTYPPDTCENNLRMFFNLQKHNDSSIKMINLSSGSEYARKYLQKKMPENYFDKHVPEDSHSYSKYLITKYIRDANCENIISLRIFGIFGKYEDYRYKFISNSIVKNLLKMPIVINQNVVYDYLYIDDFAKIVEFFVKNKTTNKIFNVNPTKSIDLLTIANLVNKVSDYQSEIYVLNEGIGIKYSGDNSALLAEIGDFEFTEYGVAVAKLYQYYKDIAKELDVETIKQDPFLSYAKKLHRQYFRKYNEK